MTRPRVVAIVPAAGSGKRLGSRKKKPFVILGGKPLIVYALKALNSSAYIDKIIIAGGASSIGRIKKIVRKYGLNKTEAVIKGGRTRAESVRNCFNAIKTPCDMVLVHDAARPFLSDDAIKSSIRCAEKHGACITAIRQTDTVKSAQRDMFIQKTLDRSLLWRAQTPQVFKYSLFKKAIKLMGRWRSITDDSYILERMGKRVKISEGSERNIKITTKEDLKIAEVFL